MTLQQKRSKSASFKKNRQRRSGPQVQRANYLRRAYFENLEDRCLLAADWFEQQAFIGHDTTPDAPLQTSIRFGDAVAIDGDTMVVGAPNYDVTIFGDAGAAFVYVRDDNGTPGDNSDDSWVQQAELFNPDPANNDNFGFSVAVSGDTVVVGNVFDDDLGVESGSAYVFTRTAGVWTQQAKLTALDGNSNDQFGYSVGVSGDTVVVGSPLDNAPLNDSGSVYVFTRSGSVWSQQAKLDPASIGGGDVLGRAVEIDGDTLVASARGDDDGGSNAGAAYVFTRSAGVWSEQAKLVASDPGAGDLFAWSISLEGDTIAVGNRLDDVLVGGDLLVDAGSVYVFTRSGSVWTEEAHFISSDLDVNDQFGTSVAVYGDILAVGSPEDQDFGPGSGGVYIFERSGGAWTEQTKLYASDVTPGFAFALTMDMSGDTVLVGSPLHILGGAAYVYVPEAVNNDPVATDDSYVTNEDTILIGNVITDDTGSGADSDADLGDVLTVSEVNGSAAAVGFPQVLASGATVTVNSDGSLSYDPDGQFESLLPGESEVDSFEYTISDGNDGEATAMVTITVNGVNDQPIVAGALSDVTANEDDPNVVVDVSALFDDVDANDVLTLSVSNNTNPTLVSADLSGGLLTLDFLPDQSGTAEITVRATDIGGLFAEETMTVTVLSAADQVENIEDEVEALLNAGDLNGGNANALTSKLNGALSKLNSGNNGSAVNKLNAFINQVNAFVNSGKLTSAQGDALIALAEAAIASASEGGSMVTVEGADDPESGLTAPIEHAGELVMATIGVSLDDSIDSVTADEQARLEDALTALNESFGAYGVSLVVLGDPAEVDVEFHVVIADTSPLGGYEDGVLASTSGPGEITIVSGWDWYTGADTTAIDVGQYDFQTALTHELGHALGLGHSGDVVSVMHSWLSDSATHRELTTYDLALIEAEHEGGPQALRAAPRLATEGEQSEIGIAAPIVISMQSEGTGQFLTNDAQVSPSLRLYDSAEQSRLDLLFSVPSDESDGLRSDTTFASSDRFSLATWRTEETTDLQSWTDAVDEVFSGVEEVLEVRLAS